MNSRQDISSGSPVLRGVLVHSQPHALVRPGKATVAAVPGAHQPSSSQSAPSASASHAIHEAAIAEAREAGYAAGFTAGEKQASEKFQRDIDEARLAAVEEARLEGLQRGLQEAKAHLRPRAERLESLIEAAGVEIAHWMANAEDDIVALSHEAMCRLLGAHAAEPAAIRAIVRHLIAQHGQRANLAVHVHPDDAQALQAEQLARATEPAWHWVPDNAVELGGVVLRSPEGSLDARLETQLGALREALLAVRNDRKSKARPEVRDPDPAMGVGP